MTSRWGRRDSFVINSSVIPSLKYSSCGALLMLTNGNTASDGIVGSGSAGFSCDGIDADVRGGRSDRFCTSTMVATAIASPVNDRLVRQYLRGIHCFPRRAG